MTDSDDRHDGEVEHDRLMTTEYGVSLTLERGSKYIWAGRNVQYWSPKPESRDEAVKQARGHYGDEVTEIHGVKTREVPEPEGWSE